MIRSMIAHYAGTTFEKSIISESGDSASGNSPYFPFSLRNTGFWRSASAINQIVIIPAANNFKAGSLFTLYGIN
jgi:hypothetical protein